MGINTTAQAAIQMPEGITLQQIADRQSRKSMPKAVSRNVGYSMESTKPGRASATEAGRAQESKVARAELDEVLEMSPGRAKQLVWIPRIRCRCT